MIVVTGTRQSGKTSLCRHLYPEYRYVNLENINVRANTAEDPTLFLESLGDMVIIDEVQHVLELLSMIQVRVDEDNKLQFPPYDFYQNYYNTYVERDLLKLSNILSFDKFVRFLAIRVSSVPENPVVHIPAECRRCPSQLFPHICDEVEVYHNLSVLLRCKFNK